MKVEDVSHMSRLMDVLKSQKTALENARKRKGERPKDRFNRDQLINEHMLHYHGAAMRKQQSDAYEIHTSFVAPPYAPSTKTLDELKKINVRDLKLQTHHRGNYLLLKAVTPPNVVTAVMAIMEDESGEGVMLQLYQHETWDEQAVRDLIQVNRVCIVKEPYFKIMADGHYGLRVDHVSDIVWISTGDERIPLRWQPRISELKEANKLKEEGNAAIKAGNVRGAAELYTRAILASQDDFETHLIKLNRSLAHLKLGFYDKSITDAGKLTKDVQKSEKGYYRAARSLYELGRFNESHEALASLLAEYPDCEAARKEFVRTKCRLREQTKGEYDFKAMYEAVKKTPPSLDHATFIGPVEIKASEDHGRGRGLFTTKAVAAGDMLLCEKAFTHCFAAQEAEKEASKFISRTTVIVNAHVDRIVMGTQAGLIKATVQKLYRNPSLLPAFTSLHHGSYAPAKETEVDGLPIVDTFLITEIIRLNSFGCPRTSLGSQFIRAGSNVESQAHHTTGVFITASYINHSCYSNARRSFIGDMQIVRATCDIPAGTEIFFWYAIPEATDGYEKAQNKFSNWGFKCTCVICQEKQKTKNSVISKRLALLEDLKSAFADPQGVEMAKAERITAALEKTYNAPASQVPRLALPEPYLLLTRCYSAIGKTTNVIIAARKLLSSLGFVLESKELAVDIEIRQWGLMESCVIEIWIHLWVAYAQVAPQLCSKAEAMARTCYKICIGEDGTFDAKYGKLAQGAIVGEKDLVAEIENLMV